MLLHNNPAEFQWRFSKILQTKCRLPTYVSQSANPILQLQLFSAVIGRQRRHQGSTRCSPFDVGCLQIVRGREFLQTISTVTPRDRQISLSELYREITKAFETSGRFRGGTISSRITQTSLTSSFHPFTQARGHQEWDKGSFTNCD
ncbi:hypothetical protein CDAR_185431 [Caerostris darwini]|uniref:Uncharacterized protein n=1 Tax=Caerostris darwini TaxID=1538125 RepID=A0AAV4QNP4_9ARAC|nr:hypothetical protein CDAR_185431 [Caerostris darwini]